MPYQLEANCLELPFQEYTATQIITDGFGALRVYGTHEGIDWDCDVGTPVHAMISGIVENTVTSFTGPDRNGGLGNRVTVRAGQFTITYGHLSTVAVRIGDKVRTDQKIGESGDTGNTFGAHLHVNFNPDEPVPGATVSLGAVDFQPYLPENTYDWSRLVSHPTENLHPIRNRSYEADMWRLILVNLDSNVTMQMAPRAKEGEKYPCDLPTRICLFPIVGKDNNDWDLPYYHSDLDRIIPTPDWWQVEVPSFPVC